MKHLRNLLFVFCLAVLSNSCQQMDDYKAIPEVLPEISENSLTINANISRANTKTNVYEIRNTWDFDDKIAVVSNHKTMAFYALNSGPSAEFVSEKKIEAKSVAAIYPYIEDLSTGTFFNYDDQKGTKRSAYSHCVMTATGLVENGVASLNFTHHVAVLAVSNVVLEDMNEDAYIKSISLKGVSSEEKIYYSGGRILFSASNSQAITINTNLKQTVYIAFPVEGQSKLELEINDTYGGDFHLILDNGSEFQAGVVYTVDGAKFSGGYPITFCPTVAGWDEN